jgi:hypothetical protein
MREKGPWKCGEKERKEETGKIRLTLAVSCHSLCFFFFFFSFFLVNTFFLSLFFVVVVFCSFRRFVSVCF